MRLDRQHLFSDAQALTVGTTVSTDVIDLGVARRLFEGRPLTVAMTVDVAANTTGGNTYEFILQTDDNEAFSSATTLVTRTIAAATLAAATLHTIPVPTEAAVERYVRMSYVLAGATSAVTVTTFLQPSEAVEQRRVYPDSVTVQ